MALESTEAKLIEVDQRCRSNTHRIDKLEQSTEALSELTTSVRVMVTKQDYIAKSVDGLHNEVTTLKSKPGKRWESIVDKLVLTLVGALIGFVMSRIGLM